MSKPLVIVREFNAPRQKVWDAWTSPEAVKKWWGPENFTAPTVEMDFRVGGKYLFCMQGPPGTEFDKKFWSTGEFKEIVPLEKLVWTDNFSDEHGNIVSSEEHGVPGIPNNLLVTVEFEELGNNKTKMTLTHEGLPEGQMSEMTSQGWNGSFDKLAASLK